MKRGPGCNWRIAQAEVITPNVAEPTVVPAQRSAWKSTHFVGLSQACKACSFSVMSHGQLFRSATFGGFTPVSPRNSTLALFDNQPRFF